MARFGSIMKGIGKGARAVGRAGMRGLLGFDDRDLRRKKPAAADDVLEEEYDETTDETNPDFTGVNRGAWMPDAVESDGLIEEAPEMEAPPEIGMEQESLIGDLQMPTLPGMPRRSRRGGAPRIADMSGSSVQFKPADDNDTPPMPKAAMGGMEGFTPETAPAAGQIPKPSATDILMSSMDSRFKRDYPEANQQTTFEDVVRQVLPLAIPGALGRFGRQAKTAATGGLPGLTKSTGGLPQVRSKAGVPVGTSTPASATGPRISAEYMGKELPGRTAPRLETAGPAQFEMRGGTGPTPYVSPSSRPVRQIEGMRMTKPKFPGQPGVEGPLEYIPGTTVTRGGRMMGRGPNNQFGWLLD